MTPATPVLCPACGLQLRYVPLTVHQETCPVLRYPRTEADSDEARLFTALVLAGARRRRQETAAGDGDVTYSPKDIERFWSKVDKSGGDDACWIWTASCTVDGYGEFGHRREVKRAHRVSWEMECGVIPKGLHVLHKCDNPSCANPAHLSLGTNRDNVLDSLAKGRRSSRKAECNGRHKLTLTEVADIRARYASGTVNQRELAQKFGVSQVQIGHIVNGKAWK